MVRCLVAAMEYAAGRDFKFEAAAMAPIGEAEQISADTSNDVTDLFDPAFLSTPTAPVRAPGSGGLLSVMPGP